MKHLLIIAMATVLAALPAQAFEVSGLSTPESFIVDEATGNYYISNINGKPLEKDDNGFITLLNPEGRVVKLQFIISSRDDRLHAPKGMVIVGNVLYVSDIDHVRGYNKETGVQVADFNLEPLRAQFLNDMTADGEGRLYVTDMNTNRVFRIDPKTNGAATFAAGKELGSPNGIRYLPGRNEFLLVGWDGGQVLRMNMQGEVKPITKDKVTGLDGVDIDDEGNIYVSSFTGGRILRIDKRGHAEDLAVDLTTPADISLDRKKRLVLVPSFNGNRVFTLKY